MNMLFDSHAHYDDHKFDEDRDKLLSLMPEKGIGYIVNPASNMESSIECLKIADKYPYIYAAVGIHPHDASGAKDNYIDELALLAKHKKVVAIGEIGLDYHYDFSPREVQKAVFERQMQLACELSLPVIIHEREAVKDTFDIVSKYGCIGVYHCFSGSVEMAREIIKKGYYISFTGIITFQNSKRAIEAVKEVPIDRIMIETDSPYMTPVPHRGERNNSENVRLVCEKIAEIKGISFDEAAKITTENAKAFFAIE